MANNYDRHIENEAAYEAARERNIKLNRAKSGRAKWFAAHEDAQELYDWLHGAGQYADDGHKQHPLCWYANGEFYGKLRTAMNEWGGLTEGQTNAVRNGLAKAKERLAEREAKRAEEKAELAANSAHIGSVGERRVFNLVVERSFTFETQFGETHINLCKDLAGNVVVYKGSHKWEQGLLSVKATVKAHDVRDGVAQTIISRPAAA